MRSKKKTLQSKCLLFSLKNLEQAAMNISTKSAKSSLDLHNSVQVNKLETLHVEHSLHLSNAQKKLIQKMLLNFTKLQRLIQTILFKQWNPRLKLNVLLSKLMHSKTSSMMPETIFSNKIPLTNLQRKFLSLLSNLKAESPRMINIKKKTLTETKMTI
jgi:hypothetical protein